MTRPLVRYLRDPWVLPALLILAFMAGGTCAVTLMDRAQPLAPAAPHELLAWEVVR